MKTIFYSWQSDIPAVRNKFKTALESAAKQLGDALEEADRPEIDHDTKGSYGSVDILETIFNKIDLAAVFVADVTPIARVGKKWVPNPNVMAEVGYALRTKSLDTCLYLYCVEEEVVVREMPFDISGKSLTRFEVSQGPAEIAKELMPRLNGMLKLTSTDDNSDKPYIYVSGGSFEQYSDATTMTMQITNYESRPYFLSAIEVEGLSSEPKRTLAPNAITNGVVINNVTKTFARREPLVKMTVSSGNRKFYIEQKILTQLGADEQFHFMGFEEQPLVKAV